MEVDELILHVQKANGDSDETVRAILDRRFVEETETHPNRILFHDAGELRRMQGVGSLLKEQRVVDHRPRAALTAAPPRNAEPVAEAQHV